MLCVPCSGENHNLRTCCVNLVSKAEKPQISLGAPPVQVQMEPTDRIELSTCCLRNSCSTTELRWRCAFELTVQTGWHHEVCHDNGRYPLCITSSMISPRTRFLPRYVYLVQSLFGDLCLAADRTPTPRKMSSATHFRRSLTSRAIVFVGVAG